MSGFGKGKRRPSRDRYGNKIKAPPKDKLPHKRLVRLTYTELDMSRLARFANPEIMRHVQELTERETKAEKLLRAQLCSERFASYPCYPQTMALGFILDFYMPTVGLAIEVDGKIHEKQRSYDARRTAELGRTGISVIRFKNEEIETDINRVLEKIERRIAKVLADRAEKQRQHWLRVTQEPEHGLDRAD